MMSRILYLGYYIKITDWKKLGKFIRYVAGQTGRTTVSLVTDMIISSVRYNISFLEYFYFRFYEKSNLERSTYAGTGYMYEYQRIMNPPSERDILDNKIRFYKAYAPFVRHKVASFDELENREVRKSFLTNSSGKIVLKDAHGKCGFQVKVAKTQDYQENELISRMKTEQFDLLEEFVVQHPALMELSPSALNTVRIFTQLDDQNDVVYLGSRLRISVNSHVDNLAAGNIAAPIDQETGVIVGPGIYSDITKEDVTTHPITGVSIVGFQIPFWDEILNLTKKAALAHPQNRSIGWDIAVTAKGPELIEGNHDWCKLVWQLPVKKGLKAILDSHRKAYKKN